MTYKLTKFQTQLLSSSQNTSKTILPQQRNSITRLQFYNQHKKLYIRSLLYEDRHIRILLIALLCKIYSLYNQVHQELLQTLKQLVYVCQFVQVVHNYGIQRNELMKMVIMGLQQLKVGQEQQKIINMVNCRPFIDQLLITAMKEEMKRVVGRMESGFDNLEEQLKEFMMKVFKLELRCDGQCRIQDEIGRQLCVWLYKGEWMREVKEVGQSLAVSLVETESESGTESRVKNKAIYQTVYIESSQSPGQIDNNKNGLSECGSLVESREGKEYLGYFVLQIMNGGRANDNSK